MYPAQSVQWAYLLISAMLLVSIYTVAIAWSSLIKKRLRVYYIPVFMSACIFLLSLSFAIPAMGSDFHVVPAYGPVQELVDRTHPVLLTNLHSIKYGVDEIPSTPWDDNTDNLGEYNGVFRSIVMVENNSDVEFTYWHEVAHHVWYWLLSDEERAVWEGVFVKDTYVLSSGGFPYFVSDYASTNVQEDFAETFARYVYDYYVSDDYRWNYRTENIDPERLFLLKMFLQSIFDGSDCYELPTVACVVVDERDIVRDSDDFITVEVTFQTRSHPSI